MKILVFDAESFYCTKTKFSLSSMTSEEYIRDPRFEIIMFSIGWLGQPKRWYSGTIEYLRSILAPLPWHEICVVGHNMSGFDSLILTHHLHVRPRLYGCTLQLARCIHGGKTADGKNLSNALGALARMYQPQVEAILGRPLHKGDAVVRANGKRRLDFSPAELAEYGQYCDDDTDLADALWQILAPQFPKSQLFLASTVTRMFAEPRILLDQSLLAQMRDEMAVRKVELLTRVADILGVGPTMAPEERMYHTQKLLRSDLKFAEVLRHFGVEPPTKLSPKKRDADGRALRVFAFAKTDEGMTELLEFDQSEDEEFNDIIQALAAARLGSKSTINESRVMRLHGVSTRGLLPVSLEYGKTLTERLAGGGRLNMQNMGQVKGITKKTPPKSLIVTPAGPSIIVKRAPDMSQILDAQGNVWPTKAAHVVGLRDMITAPPGYKLVVADLSNIELRMCHYLCGQNDTMDLLRALADLYCEFATTFYGRTITKADYKERQHGKVAMLQLQFQSGAEAFRKAARIMAGVRLTDLEAQNTVDVYRAKYDKIKAMWYTGQRAIPRCAQGGGFYLDERGLVFVEHNALRLPDGTKLRYHNLRQEEMLGFDGLPETQWVYDDKEKRCVTKTYGGKFGVQGPTQALSNRVIVHHQNIIERTLGAYDRVGEGVVLAVHDEVVAVVRDDRAEDALKFMLDVMHNNNPDWCPDLPLAAEGAIGQRYSDCK